MNVTPEWSLQPDYNIKDKKWSFRQKQMSIKNVYMMAAYKFLSSKDFNALLGNHVNKIPLQAFLQKEF